jgi:quercetin dioxygenase-like cupin family protein
MHTATTLKLTAHESLTIRESTPEVLEVEVDYGPGGKPPPAHYHPSHDEHFEVLEGAVQARLDGADRILGEGDTLDIPAGTSHQMWNPGGHIARAIWRSTPRGRTEEWFEAIDALHHHGRVGRNGMPSPIAFAALLARYDDVIRLSAKPEPLVRAGLGLLAPLGRLRGY